MAKKKAKKKARVKTKKAICPKGTTFMKGPMGCKGGSFKG